MHPAATADSKLPPAPAASAQSETAQAPTGSTASTRVATEATVRKSRAGKRAAVVRVQQPTDQSAAEAATTSARPVYDYYDNDSVGQERGARAAPQEVPGRDVDRSRSGRTVRRVSKTRTVRGQPADQSDAAAAPLTLPPQPQPQPQPQPFWGGGFFGRGDGYGDRN
jgi:hypothetical protein